MMKFVIASSIILASAIAASAHLGTLTEPKAGQTYQVGSTLAIKWSVDQPHPGGIDVAYSKANGSWVNITTTSLGINATTYNWSIPAAAQGNDVRIRICQRPSSGGCTDAHNTSAPRGVEGTSLYTLVSGNFTIAAPATVRSASSFEEASLAYRHESRNVEVAFTLAAAERVTLEAFDAQGKRIAMLLDDHKAAGRHTFSVFSHALISAGPMVLRLQAGDKVLQQSLNAR